MTQEPMHNLNDDIHPHTQNESGDNRCGTIGHFPTQTVIAEAGIESLLSKPVDQDVVETMLILECVRVKRRRVREAVNKLNRLTATEHQPIYIRSKPW